MHRDAVVTFYDTIHCKSGLNCTLCRNVHGGAAWRGRMGAYFGLRKNFACPRGRPWNYRGSLWERFGAWRRRLIALWRQPSEGLGDTVAKMTKSVEIQPCGGCKQRQAALNKYVPYGHKE